MNAATSPRNGAKPRTVLQAIAEASRTPPPLPPTYSCFKTENVTRRANGRRISRRAAWRHNLTTDTASGYTNRRDWQAKMMGMGPSSAFAVAVGNATSFASNVMTAPTGFPTSGQGLQGQYIFFGPNASGTGSKVYGVIVANTATTITVDQFYDPTSTSGAAGTAPNGTASYYVVPGNVAASWLALTSSGTTVTSADTTLASEATTNGFARAVGTYAHTAAASTFTLAHTFTAAGSLTVNNEAMFAACNTTAGGAMPFASAEPTPPALLSADTLAQTCTITIG